MERFLEFCEAWGERYPAIVRLWENAWAEFVPFLSFDVEIRKIICTTNAIESVNSRIRRAVKARGHFPNEAAALKCLCLAIMSLNPTGQGRKRWSMRWNPALTPMSLTWAVMRVGCASSGSGGPPRRLRTVSSDTGPER